MSINVTITSGRSAEGGSRQAPTIVGQETVNIPFMLEAQMIKSSNELPEDVKAAGRLWSGNARAQL